MNQFEELCRLASQENWCWKLTCTTCAHLHFRYAFAELANGKLLFHPDWEINVRDGTSFLTFGESPDGLNKDQKQALLEICLDADLLVIAKNCRFPDWLGYLGLILHHTSGTSSDYRRLSETWSSQLEKLVIRDTPIHQKLCQIANGDAVLVIHDLEAVERSIDNNKLVESIRSI